MRTAFQAEPLVALLALGIMQPLAHHRRPKTALCLTHIYRASLGARLVPDRTVQRTATCASHMTSAVALMLHDGLATNPSANSGWSLQAGDRRAVMYRVATHIKVHHSTSQDVTTFQLQREDHILCLWPCCGVGASLCSTALMPATGPAARVSCGKIPAAANASSRTGPKLSMSTYVSCDAHHHCHRGTVRQGSAQEAELLSFSPRSLLSCNADPHAETPSQPEIM